MDASEFCRSRGLSRSTRFLGGLEGILRTDGHAAYHQVGGSEDGSRCMPVARGKVLC